MLCCMRTTVRLEDRLLRQVKEYAARNGRTLTSVMEDALRQFLARTRPPARKGVAFPTYRGQGGLRPGVDLDDTASLLDLMEEGLPVDKRR